MSSRRHNRKQKTENRKQIPGNRKPNEAGVALLLVIWIMALLSLIILSYAGEWRTELQLAANFRESRQNRRLAEAGVYYALGKLMAARLADAPAPSRPGGPALETAKLPEGWRPDQTSQILELPSGRAEVRLTDEGGKINLNLADERILTPLFAVLGFPAPEIPALVDAVLDWRDRDSLRRPQGAESDYYLSLAPPYPAKNDRFDRVEELAWVRGFGAGAGQPLLANCLTVQETGQRINLNAAIREALQALGLPREQAETLIQVRQAAPLRRLEDLPALAQQLALQPLLLPVSFDYSIFFTIISKGMIKNGKGHHLIKAVVRLEVGGSPPWKIVEWDDDYPW